MAEGFFIISSIGRDKSFINAYTKALRLAKGNLIYSISCTLIYGFLSTLFKLILLLELPCNRDCSGNPFFQKRLTQIFIFFRNRRNSFLVLKRKARPERLEKQDEGIAQIIIRKKPPEIREVPIANYSLPIAYIL